MRESYRQVASNPDHSDNFLANQSAVVSAFGGWTDEQIAVLSNAVHTDLMHRTVPIVRSFCAAAR